MKHSRVHRELMRASKALARAAKAIDAELSIRPVSIPEPELPPLQTCEHCGQVFAAKGLVMHQRLKHGAGLLPPEPKRRRAAKNADGGVA